MQPNQTLGLTQVHRGLISLFDDDLHAKRVLSLANATLGVVRSASLAVDMIGQGLALARGLLTKHAIKQVDRMLSNQGIDVDAAAVSTGYPMSSASGPASRWRWTGPSSTTTARRRSCCRC